VRRCAALLIGAALAPAGCHIVVDAPARPLAVLVAPDAAARAELVGAVSRELHAASPVRLADDALVTASELIIERDMPRDAEGRPFDGRERGRPEHFWLRLVNDRCTLEHEGGSSATLRQAHCVAASH
jgi:hypothetical protein